MFAPQLPHLTRYYNLRVAIVTPRHSSFCAGAYIEDAVGVEGEILHLHKA